MNVEFPGIGTVAGFISSLVLMAGTTGAIVWYMRKRLWV
jgi:Mg2+ and Co2+ transporter CorA